MLAGFFEAGRDRLALDVPLVEECLAFLRDGRSIGGVDHVLIISRDLFGEFLRRMRDQVPELVHRTVLDRQIRPQRCERLLQSGRAVDNGKLGFAQTALGQIIQYGSPRSLALAAHVLHG